MADICFGTHNWRGSGCGGATAGTAVGIIAVGAAIGGAISYGTQAVSGELNWGQFALDIGVGALTGAIGASGLSLGVATALSGLIGSGSSIASDLINGNSVDWGTAAVSGLIGVVAGYAGGAGVKNVQGLSSSIYKGFSSNLTKGIVNNLINNAPSYLLPLQNDLFGAAMRWYVFGTLGNFIVNLII